MIIPKTIKLTVNISLSGTDKDRTLVKNLGRNIIRKLAVKLKGNEIVTFFIHIMTVGKLKLRDIILSFKVWLKIMVK